MFPNFLEQVFLQLLSSWHVHVVCCHESISCQCFHFIPSENTGKISGNFRGYKMRTFTRNGLNIVMQNNYFCECLSFILVDEVMSIIEYY